MFLPHELLSSVLLLITYITEARGRDIPENLRDFYDTIRNRGSCSVPFASGFYATDPGPDTFSYCGDFYDDYDVLYLQGQQGALADMDVDCDGAQRLDTAANDGRCNAAMSPDVQGITAFQDTVASYNAGILDLDPYVHPYVVFGNIDSGSNATNLTEYDAKKQGWRTFDPTAYGVQPLSVMAVVCNDQLLYGIWGDTNGDDGDHPMVGEASISLATACEGMGMNGENGYSDTDILYVAFKGEEAVPGPEGADWGAEDFATFERSIEGLGDRLVERIGEAGRTVRPLDGWEGVVVGALVFVVWGWGF